MALHMSAPVAGDVCHAKSGTRSVDSEVDLHRSFAVASDVWRAKSLTPTVGLEPTTTRLRALRSTD